MLLPWLSVICLAAPAALVFRGRLFGPEIAAPIAGIFGISLLFCNSFFTGWAINELRDRFRALAAQS
jgi:hypothetical protein